MTSLAPRYDVYGGDPTKWDNSWAKRQIGDGNGDGSNSGGQNGNNGNGNNNGDDGLLPGLNSALSGLFPGQSAR